MGSRIEALFERAGCDGQLCIQSPDGAGGSRAQASPAAISAGNIVGSFR